MRIQHTAGIKERKVQCSISREDRRRLILASRRASAVRRKFVGSEWMSI